MHSILADIGLLIASSFAGLFAIVPSVASHRRLVWLLTAIIAIGLTLFQYRLVAETGRGVFDHAACFVFPEGDACRRLALQRASATPDAFTQPHQDSTRAGERFVECRECPEMVVLPAREFLMGSPDDERDRYGDEGPQRRVQPRAPSAISHFEVTRAQYAAFANATDRPAGAACVGDTANGRAALPELDWRTPGFPQTENDPVVCVSWFDAQDYVLWLNAASARQAETGSVRLVLAAWLDIGAHRPGLINRVRRRVAHELRDDITGPYRLPSEAEWEYAARSGATGAYGGTARRGLCAVANHAASETELPWRNVTCSDGAPFTAPVGQYAANAFGLNDMRGNAWEWVRDCYETTLDGIMADGGANEQKDCQSRAFRGGSWGDEPEALRFANRSTGFATMRSNRIGFRVARDLSFAAES